MRSAHHHLLRVLLHLLVLAWHLMLTLEALVVLPVAKGIRLREVLCSLRHWVSIKLSGRLEGVCYWLLSRLSLRLGSEFRRFLVHGSRSRGCRCETSLKKESEY